MNGELKKSLTDLIDETLLELEELKKSRFSAAEIEIKGPGADSLAGKPVNGKLGAEKAEDEDEKDEDKKDDEAEKAEGKNSEIEKKEEKDEDKKEDEPHKDDPKHEEKEKDMAKKLLDMHKGEDDKIAGLKKSMDDMESLMKGYIDSKVVPLESKLSSILDMVTKLADAPVPAKGVSYKAVAPLMKSNDAGEPLTKSEVASKLFELKKSGSRVDSADIARAEMGHDLEKIVAKYSIK